MMDHAADTKKKLLYGLDSKLPRSQLHVYDCFNVPSKTEQRCCLNSELQKRIQAIILKLKILHSQFYLPIILDLFRKISQKL